MASRFRRIILAASLSAPMLIVSVSAMAEESAGAATVNEGGNKSGVTDPAGISAGEGAVLDPRIERRRVKEAQIDAENFEVGAYVGLISIEDFGVNSLTGVHAAFHISEDIFFEGAIAVAKGGETNFERLNSGVQLLSDDDREFRTWHFDVGYQVLPGESFLGSHRAFNTGLYVIGGAGSTTFGGDDHFTINAGAGYRVLLTDWLSARLEMRDYIYEIDTFGEDQTTQNLAWTLGLSGFF
jgi:outer membrane beta-barrel protein